MKYLDDKEIKKELVQSLYEFKEFLEYNRIQYSIMSGTMLGCIRHGGFIPWDDDIDIAMLRTEYEKMLEIFRKNPNINEHLYASGAEIDDSELPFVKIYNTKIKVEDEALVNTEYLWIDVFPFDGLPKRNFRMFEKYINNLKRVYHYRRRDWTRNCDDIRNFRAKRVVTKISRIVSDKKYVKFLIHECSKYNTNNVERVEDLTWGNKSIPRFLFDDFVEYKFENITVKGFKEFDTYLRCIYGDYMQLTPERERINHGIKAWRINNNEE